MGGFAVNRPGMFVAAEHRGTGDDPCDLRFQVELVGVRSEVAARLAVPCVLEVAIVERGEVASAVCRTEDGDIVGALAAFRGLAQLIRCLKDEVPFVALIIAVSATRCEVRVERVQ